MNAESTLARVNAILAMSDDPTPARTELEKLAADLAAQVRQQAAASRGVGNAAKNYFADAQGLAENRPPPRPALRLD